MDNVEHEEIERAMRPFAEVAEALEEGGYEDVQLITVTKPSITMGDLRRLRRVHARLVGGEC